jgi:hypothetical protein
MFIGLAYGPQHANGQRGPGWLDLLGDAAIGKVRMSDGARGNSAPRLKGDDEVLPKCTCGHPEHELRDECAVIIPGEITVIKLAEPDTEGNTSREIHAPDHPCTCREYVPKLNQAKIRNGFLAAGRVNTKASRAYHEAQNTLTTIVRAICESRGVTVRSVRAVQPSFIGPLRAHDVRCDYHGDAHLAALWLSERVPAIAADEAAGQHYADVARLVTSIETLINKPIPMRFCGKCPTWIEDKRAICGTDLRCREDAPEVYCRHCRATHNPDRLQLLLQNDLERKDLTFDKILKANLTQPVEFQIKPRMLRLWRQQGKLKVHAYLRPCSCSHRYTDHRADATRCSKCDCTGFDGRKVINRHSDDDEPLYRWPDVRQLRAEVPKRKAKVKAS